jgi:hypothetical protein
VDVDYLAYAILMGVLGVVGLTATANVSPNIFSASTCNCIPTPAARLQELSVVLVVFSLVLAPVGLRRRGSEKAGAEQLMRSGGLFVLGVALVVLGVALVAVPSFLVLGNSLLVAEGVDVVVLGAVIAYAGGRSA